MPSEIIKINAKFAVILNYKKNTHNFHNHYQNGLFCTRAVCFVFYFMIMRVFSAHEHENSTLNIRNSTLTHGEGVYDRSEGIMT